MPTSDVTSAPLVGIFINDSWRAVLLSLAANAEKAWLWANEADIDRIEQNAFNLYEAILNPQTCPEARVHYIGEPFAMFTATAPDGALAMNGIPRIQADYPELMGKIPASWKTGNYFTLPNMATRGLFGAFALTELNAPVGSTFGEVFHTLTVDEIPNHQHQQVSAAGVGLVVDNGFTGWQTLGGASAAGQPATPLMTIGAGGDAPHLNMPPGLACYWFIQAV